METEKWPRAGQYGPVEVGQYFVVDDGPAWDLMCGDPDTATGVCCASRPSQAACVAAAPAGVPVWRVYLRRTDGKTGKRLIRS